MSSFLLHEERNFDQRKLNRGLDKPGKPALLQQRVGTMHTGPDFILVNISVYFTDPASANEIEKALAGLDGKIKNPCPQVKRVFIEA
jgi:hypothetical protein